MEDHDRVPDHRDAGVRTHLREPANFHGRAAPALRGLAKGSLPLRIPPALQTAMSG